MKSSHTQCLEQSLIEPIQWANREHVVGSTVAVEVIFRLLCVSGCCSCPFHTELYLLKHSSVLHRLKDNFHNFVSEIFNEYMNSKGIPHFAVNLLRLIVNAVLFLCLLSKTEASCVDGSDSPSLDPPKVMKIFNRSVLFDCVSRGDPGALEGLLEYLQSNEKRLTDEEFRGENHLYHTSVYRLSKPSTGRSDYKGIRRLYHKDAVDQMFLICHLRRQCG